LPADNPKKIAFPPRGVLLKIDLGPPSAPARSSGPPFRGMACVRHFSFFAACAVCLCGTVAPCAAPATWLTGARLDEQLAAAVSVTWSNLPLARALESLSASQNVAVVIDRRVDPDQPIGLTLSSQPLGDAFRRIAEQMKLGYCQFGPVAYFGPPETASRLRTLAALRSQEARALPTAEARRFFQPRAMRWDELAEPRRLVEKLAAEAGVTLAGAQKIPHDLWPAAELPPMTWLDRMTLLTAQFDLAFRIADGGREVELTQMPAKVALSRTHEVGREADTIARRWAESLPQAKISVHGNKIQLDGLLEDHEFVERRLRAPRGTRSKVTDRKEVYQFSVENTPLDKVVQQLGQRLNVDFHWDRAAIDAAGIATDQAISVRVKDASLDDLVSAVLKDTGLTFHREDRTISIGPSE
jgi:hypothetical protein